MVRFAAVLDACLLAMCSQSNTYIRNIICSKLCSKTDIATYINISVLLANACVKTIET